MRPRMTLPTNQARKGSQNLVRIIGGQWRSRRLKFAAVPGLRPTPDRVRETLFNWLQGKVAGADCLDLFAGSGALGFEALSRGANSVVMVEKHPDAAQALKDNVAVLQTQQAQIIQDDAMRYLQRVDTAFDLIFLDPPFRQNKLATILEQITSKHLLKPQGMVYLEQELEAKTDFAAFGFHPHRTTTAGQVQSLLLVSASA